MTTRQPEVNGTGGGHIAERASEPCPCCQKNTTEPKTAANETRLSRTALIGSSSDRNVRTTRRKVITEIRIRTYGSSSYPAVR